MRTAMPACSSVARFRYTELTAEAVALLDDLGNRERPIGRVQHGDDVATTRRVALGDTAQPLGGELVEIRFHRHNHTAGQGFRVGSDPDSEDGSQKRYAAAVRSSPTGRSHHVSWPFAVCVAVVVV